MKWRCKLANNLSHLFQAFDLKRHPLGRLVNRLVDVFRASYFGMGTHRRLLPHAVAETKSFVIRVYSIVRYDLDCKTVRIFAYSSTRERSNKRSGTRLKTESETGERREKFFSLASHALRACETRALRARKTLTPGFTDFFTDFEKKTDCFDCFAV